MEGDGDQPLRGELIRRWTIRDVTVGRLVTDALIQTRCSDQLIQTPDRLIVVVPHGRSAHTVSGSSPYRATETDDESVATRLGNLEAASLHDALVNLAGVLSLFGIGAVFFVRSDEAASRSRCDVRSVMCLATPLDKLTAYVDHDDDAGASPSAMIMTMLVISHNG
jgi:hypothetical protein